MCPGGTLGPNEMVPLPLSQGFTTTVRRESAAVMGSRLSCRNIPHLRGSREAVTMVRVRLSAVFACVFSEEKERVRTEGS